MVVTPLASTAAGFVERIETKFLAVKKFGWLTLA
jgi:hypothetical protein